MDKWKEQWDNLYNTEDYMYGEEPNSFYKNTLNLLKAGNILFPAEGEGRNAVYAAKLGWKVSAFDISKIGQKKAIDLAKKNNVDIDYRVGDISDFNFKPEQFDVIVLIFSHFPKDVRSKIHNNLKKYLKKEGIIIFEAFSKNHIEKNKKNKNVGGPKDIDLLFSEEELINDFSDFEILELKELEIELNEGKLHNGVSSVIRFIAKKK